MAIPAFTLATRLRAGEPVFSGWCGLPYPLIAETLGRDGFVAVTVESQHGLWDVNGILAGIAAIRQGGAAPLVRVPFGDFALQIFRFRFELMEAALGSQLVFHISKNNAVTRASGKIKPGDTGLGWKLRAI